MLGFPFPWVATLKSNWSSQTTDCALEILADNKRITAIKYILFFHII